MAEGEGAETSRQALIAGAREANGFAAEFLMPEPAVRAEVIEEQPGTA